MINFPLEIEGVPVTVIAKSCDISNATKIIFPDTVKYIYADTTDIEEVYVPASLETSYVDIDKPNHFGNKLKRAFISTNLVAIPEGLFNGCKELDNVDLRFIEEIGENAFRSCSSLTSVYIPNVTKIGSNAFYGCKSLTSVDIPEGVTVIPYYGFCECTNLENVSLPDGIVKIENYAFDGCNKVQVTYKGKSFDCNHISDILSFESSINEDMTVIEGDVLIKYLGSDESFIVPDNIKEIGESAFSHCISLRNVDLISHFPADFKRFNQKKSSFQSCSVYFGALC